MVIGIDASRAFVQNRTGIEEYSYQVIKSLMNELKEHQARLASTRLDSFESKRANGYLRESKRVILYVRRSQKSKAKSQKLPDNWKIKTIKWPYLWTQIGLSLELLFHPVDTLFVPAHTVPIIHPENTIVTVHGLEYEFCPKAYSFWERIYMRCVIKNSVRWAKKIIAVSENTKRDLIKLYDVSSEKIEVIYEGVDNSVILSEAKNLDLDFSRGAQDDKFLLSIGRLEERKNILGIIEAFEILKEKHKIPHKLVLAGNAGYGYDSINLKIQSSKFKEEIIFKGFVGEEEKFELLRKAEIFLFPSFYEGFGLPILEAQSAGVPVVTSNISSMPEIADSSAILVDPNKPEEIAEAAFKLISDESLKNDIINKGFENVKRFSWDKCSKEISKLFYA
jgi:glycosyltransferase involved in cell wall biosynthesis